MIINKINNEFIQLFIQSKQVESLKEKTKLRYLECLHYYAHEYLEIKHQLTLDEGWYEIDEFIVNENYLTSKTQLNYFLRAIINFYDFLYREAYITQKIKDAVLAMISYNREVWSTHIEVSQSTSDEDTALFPF